MTLVATRMKSAVSALAVALGTLLASASPAFATPIVYQYTGNVFANSHLEGPTTPADVYTLTDRVTATIVLAAPLTPNIAFSLANVATPLSFTIRDGVNTITNANALDFLFAYGTDAAGLPNAWSLFAQLPTSAGGAVVVRAIRSDNYLGGPFGIQDGGVDTLCGPNSPLGSCAMFGDPYYSQAAWNSGSPGVWSQQPVPEPATLLLLGGGLSALAARARAKRPRRTHGTTAR